MSKQTTSSIRNRLLATLSMKDYNHLLPDLELVQLPQSEILYYARQPMYYVYFPTTAVLSWFVLTEQGDIVEAGISGNEGMVGVQALFGIKTTPFHVYVQTSGTAWRMKVDAFKAACSRSVALQSLLLRYAATWLVQLAQSAACNRFHTVEERLSRWLLMIHDRAQSDILPLTHEILANIIGARRPAVTLVVGTLQKAGLIHAKRGSITIVDRQGLEAAACECYRIVKKELDEFLASLGSGTGKKY